MKKVVFTFGRMNPPTIGHEKLVNKLKDVAVKEKADARLYLSHTSKPGSDPLSYNDKIKFAQKAFGIAYKSSAKQIFQIAKEFQGEGYTDVIMVVGSDRVKEFDTLLKKYNGKGDYDFDSIKVVSAGQRDPDATGVEGMSGTKLRNLAKDGDMKTFMSGLASGLSVSDKKKIYALVSKNMKESYFDIEMDNILMEDSLSEKPLTVQQRVARGRIMKKLGPKMAKARARNAKRMADPRQIKQRAQKAAINAVRKKVAGKKGLNYANLSPSDKMNVDKMVQKKSALIAKIAKKSIPIIRKKEQERLAKMRSSKTEGISEEAEISLRNKAAQSGIMYDIIKEVYDRGIRSWDESGSLSAEQCAFSRVNSFITGGRSATLDADLMERNYRKEYDNYQGQPEQIARRSSRNQARRVMGDKAVVGLDVGHKDNNPLNNTPDNLRNEDPSDNRREPRLREVKAPDIKKGDTIILNKAKRPYSMAGIIDPKKTLPAESDKMVVQKITKSKQGRKAHLTYHDTKKRGGFAVYLDKMPEFMSVKIAEEVDLDEAWFNDLKAKISQLTHPKGWAKMLQKYADGMKDPEHRKHPSSWAAEIANEYNNVNGRQFTKYINKLVKQGKLPKELSAGDSNMIKSFKTFDIEEETLKKKSSADRIAAKKKKDKWAKTSAGKKSALKSKKRSDKIKSGAIKVDKARSKTAKKSAKLYSSYIRNGEDT